MSTAEQPPSVAIVGRPNVGKSSLLNRLAGRRISIVDAMSGVTRDRVTTTIDVDGRTIEIVDTGGIGIVDEHALEPEVEHQIEIAVGTSDLILFVVDVREGVAPLDEEVARRLRREKRPVLLVANKADTDRTAEVGAGEFHGLGFGEPIPISAQHGRGIPELLEQVLEQLPVRDVAPDPNAATRLSLAFIGRQNVGKSSLLNRLAKADRVIVSEVAGTTRDSVDLRFEMGGHHYVAIDTAGMKKKGRTKRAVDFFSQVRTERSIRRADVCFLLIDATQRLSMVDKNLAAYVREHAKPVVIVVNKWDLARETTTPAQYERYLRDGLRSLGFAPIAIISAKTGFNVAGLLDLARDLQRQASQRVTTAAVNKVLESARERHLPRSKKSKEPKVYYGTQVDVCPPTFSLFVNDPSLFHDWFTRYFENRLRDAFDFAEVPLRIQFRPRGGRGGGGGTDGARPFDDDDADPAG